MRAAAFLVSFLIALGASPAWAGHLFLDGGDPSISLAANQAVDIAIGSTSPSSTTGEFEITLYFDEDSAGPAADAWSSGDVLRFTLNGLSLDFDFDTPFANTTTNSATVLTHTIAFGDSGFGAYDDQVFSGNVFTVALLAGDGIELAGFTFFDRIGSTTAFTGAAGSTAGSVYTIPEPSTLFLLGLGLLGLALRPSAP